MKNLFKKIKNLIYSPIKAEGELIKTGFTTTYPKEIAKPQLNAMTHGDRKRFHTTYNEQLVNRISEIKSKNS